MAAIGGSSIELAINGRAFGIAADADIGQALKKFENEVRPNGNGTRRIIKKFVVQMLESIVVSIDDSLGDFEFLSDAYDLAEFDFSISFPSGVIYSGRGTMVGDQTRQTEASTAEITINCQNMRRQ